MPDSTLLTPAPASRAAALRQWLLVPANQLFMLLMVLVAFPLLFELGRTPIQLWDESRLAVSALEMSRGGSWLVTTFEGKPDVWNTKPPLLVWLQALSFKAFGYSAWAFRLPTALAALGTVVLLYRFAANTLHRPLAGFFGALVLVTAAGYVRLHGARTGDYDTLLTFWLVISWIAFFHYLEHGRPRDLYWLGAALLGAMLTKSVAGLLGLPAFFLYALLRGKLWWLLRQPRLYLVAGGCMAVVGAYYWAHEALAPGYLAAVSENDLGGRFNGALDAHAAPWSFYFDTLYEHDFENWIWWLIPAVLIWLQPRGVVRRAATLLLFFVLGWLLVISSAATKLNWYGIPAYPPLALLIGLGLDYLYQDVLAVNLPRLPRLLAWPVRVGLVVGLFYFPFRAIIRQFVEERTSSFSIGNDGYLSRYVGTLAREQPTLDSLTLISTGGYNAAMLFYCESFNLRPNKYAVLQYHGTVRSLRPGTVALVCDPKYRAQLDSAFQLMTAHTEGPCETVLLVSRK